MKNLRRLCAVALLSCIFAISVHAGDMSAGRTSEPPRTTESQACGEIDCGVLRSIVTLVLSVV